MARKLKKTRAQTKRQAQATGPYLRRLVEDEKLQDQLRSAFDGLRAAYARARKQGGKAAEDKRLYANLRQSATSLRQAATRLQQPKQQPKRRLQKLIAAGLAGGSAVLVIKHQQSQPKGGDAPASAGRPGGVEQPTGDSQVAAQPEHAS